MAKVDLTDVYKIFKAGNTGFETSMSSLNKKMGEIIASGKPITPNNVVSAFEKDPALAASFKNSYTDYLAKATAMGAKTGEARSAFIRNVVKDLPTELRDTGAETKAAYKNIANVLDGKKAHLDGPELDLKKVDTSHTSGRKEPTIEAEKASQTQTKLSGGPGLSKYHNLSAPELLDRQRLLALDLDRALNAPVEVGGKLTGLLSFMGRRGHNNTTIQPQTQMSMSKTVGEIVKDLDEITIAPAYKNISSLYKDGANVSPSETLEALKNGEKVSEQSYARFNKQIAKGSLGSINFFARHPIATTVIGGGGLLFGSALYSGYDYVSTPEAGYSAGQRWPALTYFAPDTWGNDKAQAVDLSIWALQKNPQVFNDPSNPFSKYLKAVKENDVRAQIESPLSADQKEAVKELKIDLDKQLAESQAGLMDQQRANVEKHNDQINKSLELEQTQMLAGWGNQSARNVVNEARSENEYSETAPSLSESFNTAHLLFKDMTKDDTYGVKGKEEVIDQSWKASIRQNKLDLTEFETQLKDHGISQEAIPVIVDYAKMAIRP